MKKKELKGTNPVLKNTSDKFAKQGGSKKKGSGGARPDSGRDPLDYEVTRFTLRMPTTLYNDIIELDIPNITKYINTLIDKDVMRRQKLKGK